MRTYRRHRSLAAKVKSRSALKKIIAGIKKAGGKVVFTNGCFDILHYGHVRYLEDAKKLGNCLVVALNSDLSVKKIKGQGRPLVRQQDRAKVIASLESVDYVTIFNETTPLTLINLLQPDLLVKGGDWEPGAIVGAKEVRDSGGKVRTIALAKGRSTTSLIKKIAKTYCSQSNL